MDFDGNPLPTWCDRVFVPVFGSRGCVGRRSRQCLFNWPFSSFAPDVVP